MDPTPEVFLLEIKRSIMAAKLGLSVLLIPCAISMVLVLSGCSEYGHIPLAGKKNTAEQTEPAQVTLQWNNVQNAA